MPQRSHPPEVYDPAPAPLSQTDGHSSSLHQLNPLQLPGTQKHLKMQGKEQRKVNWDGNNLEMRAVTVRRREV